MAVRIRLRRMGKTKRPFYRVVVADQRSPRDGRFIENIGRYHPLDDPSVIEIDEERALHWLRVGAQPSNTACNVCFASTGSSTLKLRQKVLMTKTGIWEKFAGSKGEGATEKGTKAAAKAS